MWTEISTPASGSAVRCAFCVYAEKQGIVELDGGHHDMTGAADRSQQSLLETAGGTILRFTSEDVINDMDAVAIGIARS